MGNYFPFFFNVFFVLNYQNDKIRLMDAINVN